jgi:hypothetical protein
MAGTKLGGKRAAETNKRVHGADFYARIGAEGGRKGTTGGFAADIDCNCTLLSYRHFKRNCAGKKGGIKSRRTKVGV